jgi:hypothetical protein
MYVFDDEGHRHIHARRCENAFLNLPLCRTFRPDLFISRTWWSGCLIPSFSLIPCVGRGYQLAIVVSKSSSSLLVPKGEALAIAFFTTYLLTLRSYAVLLWEAKPKLTTISIILSYHPCLFLIKWCAAVDYGWGEACLWTPNTPFSFSFSRPVYVAKLFGAEEAAVVQSWPKIKICSEMISCFSSVQCL